MPVNRIPLLLLCALVTAVRGVSSAGPLPFCPFASKAFVLQRQLYYRLPSFCTATDAIGLTVEGGLPEGLLLSASGDLVGAATEEGTFAVTVVGANASTPLTVVVVSSYGVENGYYGQATPAESGGSSMGTEYWNGCDDGRYKCRSVLEKSSNTLRDPPEFSWENTTFEIGNWFGVKSSGYVYVPFNKTWSFYSYGDDAIRFYWDDMSESHYVGLTGSYYDHVVLTQTLSEPGFHAYGAITLYDEGMGGFVFAWSSPENSIDGSSIALGPKTVKAELVPLTSVFQQNPVPVLRYASRVFVFFSGENVSIVPSEVSLHGYRPSSMTLSCTEEEASLAIDGTGRIHGTAAALPGVYLCKATLQNLYANATADLEVVVMDAASSSHGLDAEFSLHSTLYCNVTPSKPDGPWERQFLVDSVNFSADRSVWSPALDSRFVSGFVAHFSGFLQLPAGEDVVVHVSSVGAFQLSIGGKHSLSSSFSLSTGCESPVSLSLTLPAPSSSFSSLQPLDLLYWVPDSQRKGLVLEWSSASIDREVIPRSVLIPHTRIGFSFSSVSLSPSASAPLANPLILPPAYAASASVLPLSADFPPGFSFSVEDSVLTMSMSNAVVPAVPAVPATLFVRLALPSLKQDSFPLRVEFIPPATLPTSFSYPAVNGKVTSSVSVLPSLSPGASGGHFYAKTPLPDGLQLNKGTGAVHGSLNGQGTATIAFVTEGGEVEASLEVTVAYCPKGTPRFFTLTVHDPYASLEVRANDDILYTTPLMNAESSVTQMICSVGVLTAIVRSSAEYGGEFSVRNVGTLYYRGVISDNSYFRSIQILPSANAAPIVDYDSTRLSFLQGRTSFFSPALRNGAETVRFSISTPEPSLLPGLSFDPLSGMIWGTPLISGQQRIEVSASNSYGPGATVSLNLVVDRCLEALVVLQVELRLPDSVWTDLDLVSVGSNTSIVSRQRLSPLLSSNLSLCIPRGQYMLYLRSVPEVDWDTSSSVSVVYNGLSTAYRYLSFNPPPFLIGFWNLLSPTPSLMISNSFQADWQTDPYLSWPVYSLPLPPRRSLTTYYRYNFTLSLGSVPSGYLHLKFLSDSGMVVYLNGRAVYRRGLLSNFTESTPSSQAYSMTSPKEVYLTQRVLENGMNYLSFEVHSEEEYFASDPFELLSLSLVQLPSSCLRVNTYKPTMLVSSNRGYEYIRNVETSTVHVVNNLNLDDSVALTWENGYLRHGVPVPWYVTLYGDDLPQFKGDINETSPLVMTFGHADGLAKPFNMYQIITGLLQPEKDPWAWKLYGSYDNSTSEWDLLDERSSFPVDLRSESVDFFMQKNSHMSYEFYRLVITAARDWNSASGGGIQMQRLSVQHCLMSSCQATGLWPSASGGMTVRVPCGEGYLGVQTRDCNHRPGMTSAWSEDIDRSECVRVPGVPEYDVLLFLADVFASYNPRIVNEGDVMGYSSDCTLPPGVSLDKHNGTISGKIPLEKFTSSQSQCLVTALNAIRNSTGVITIRTELPRCPPMYGLPSSKIGTEKNRSCAQFQTGELVFQCTYDSNWVPTWVNKSSTCDWMTPVVVYPSQTLRVYRRYGLGTVMPRIRGPHDSCAIISGSLMNGLEFSKSDGAISGAPAQTGSRSSTVKVTCKYQSKVSASETVTISSSNSECNSLSYVSSANRIQCYWGYSCVIGATCNGYSRGFSISPDLPMFDFNKNIGLLTFKEDYNHTEDEYSTTVKIVSNRFLTNDLTVNVEIKVSQLYCPESDGYPKTKPGARGQKPCSETSPQAVYRDCLTTDPPSWSSIEDTSECQSGASNPLTLEYPPSLSLLVGVPMEAVIPDRTGKGLLGVHFSISPPELSYLLNPATGRLSGVPLESFSGDATINATEDRTLSSTIALQIRYPVCPATSEIPVESPAGSTASGPCDNGKSGKKIGRCPFSAQPVWAVEDYCYTPQFSYPNASYVFYLGFFDSSDLPTIGGRPTRFELDPAVPGLSLSSAGRVEGVPTGTEGTLKHTVRAYFDTESLNASISITIVNPKCKGNGLPDTPTGGFHYGECLFPDNIGSMDTLCPISRLPSWRNQTINNCRLKYPNSFFYSGTNYLFNCEIPIPNLVPTIRGTNSSLSFRVKQGYSLLAGLSLDALTGEISGTPKEEQSEKLIVIEAIEERTLEWSLLIAVATVYCADSPLFPSRLPGTVMPVDCPEGAGKIYGRCSYENQIGWVILNDTCGSIASPGEPLYSNESFWFAKETYVNIATPKIAGQTYPFTLILSIDPMPAGLELHWNGSITGYLRAEVGRYNLRMRACNLNSCSASIRIWIESMYLICQNHPFLPDAPPGTEGTFTCLNSVGSITASCPRVHPPKWLVSNSSCLPRTFGYSLPVLKFFKPYVVSYAPIVQGDVTKFTSGPLPPGVSMNKSGALEGTVPSSSTLGESFSAEITVWSFSHSLSLNFTILFTFPTCPSEIVEEDLSFPETAEGETFEIECMNYTYGSISRTCGHGAFPSWFPVHDTCCSAPSAPPFPTADSPVCEAEAGWDSTPSNSEINRRCPNGDIGMIRRVCDPTGNWGPVEASGCAATAPELSVSRWRVSFTIAYTGTASLLSDDDYIGLTLLLEKRAFVPFYRILLDPARNLRNFAVKSMVYVDPGEAERVYRLIKTYTGVEMMQDLKSVSLTDGRLDIQGVEMETFVKQTSKSNTAAIIGGAIGGVVLIALVGVIVYYNFRRRVKRVPKRVAASKNPGTTTINGWGVISRVVPPDVVGKGGKTVAIPKCPRSNASRKKAAPSKGVVVVEVGDELQSEKSEHHCRQSTRHRDGKNGRVSKSSDIQGGFSSQATPQSLLIPTPTPNSGMVQASQQIDESRTDDVSPSNQLWADVQQLPVIPSPLPDVAVSRSGKSKRRKSRGAANQLVPAIQTLSTVPEVAVEVENVKPTKKSRGSNAGKGAVGLPAAAEADIVVPVAPDGDHKSGSKAKAASRDASPDRKSGSKTKPASREPSEGRKSGSKTKPASREPSEGRKSGSKTKPASREPSEGRKSGSKTKTLELKNPPEAFPADPVAASAKVRKSRKHRPIEAPSDLPSNLFIAPAATGQADIESGFPPSNEVSFTAAPFADSVCDLKKKKKKSRRASRAVEPDFSNFFVDSPFEEAPFTFPEQTSFSTEPPAASPKKSKRGKRKDDSEGSSNPFLAAQ